MITPGDPTRANSDEDMQRLKMRTAFAATNEEVLPAPTSCRVGSWCSVRVSILVYLAVTCRNYVAKKENVVDSFAQPLRLKCLFVSL